MELYQKEKIIKPAEEVYNSYLLLYKLNELKVDGGKLLQSIISESMSSNHVENS